MAAARRRMSGDTMPDSAAASKQRPSVVQKMGCRRHSARVARCTPVRRPDTTRKSLSTGMLTGRPPADDARDMLRTHAVTHSVAGWQRGRTSACTAARCVSERARKMGGQECGCTPPPTLAGGRDTCVHLGGRTTLTAGVQSVGALPLATPAALRAARARATRTFRH
ncbi:hypothetical protein EON67_06140 [archaeon]|nr:MAG: hypothetical protein EON67_06140 [archaeon]